MSNSLRENLTLLRNNAHERMESLEIELQTEQSKMSSLVAQFEILQRDMRIKEAHIVRLQQELAIQTVTLNQEEQEKLKLAMQDCLDNLIVTGQRFLRKSILETERQQLLHLDPELERKLHDYQQFAQNRDTILQSLPASYHSILLVAQENRGAQLQSYMEILAQQQDLITNDEVHLELVIAPTENPTGYAFLLPVPDELQDIIPVVKNFLENLRNLVYDGIFSLIGQEYWSISDLRPSIWNNLSIIELVGEYTGSREVANVVQEVLANRFSSTATTEGVTLTCSITQVTCLKPVINIVVYTTLINDSSSETEVVLAEESEETKKVVEEIILTENPLVVPVTLHPKAEFIRKFLIYLLGYGLVGSKTISVGILQEKVRNADFEKIVGILAQAQILKVFTGQNSISEITLNPACLPKAQDLINRDITPFWEQLIQMV
ncbi:hypothetical protein [Candidatus Chlorohelix sp.]|uniref:hypothetical protein n=1 Tax=Candidatus Chlorohelix sp. TaxID=3139201 RepID=UPI0030461100